MENEKYPVVVVGDWRVRGKEGEPVEYDYTKGEKIIRLSGGVGLWHLQEGSHGKAAQEFYRELRTVREIEYVKGIRFHKGYYYYMIYLAKYRKSKEMVNIAMKEREARSALRWLRKAVKEDELSYGETAKTFPAGEDLQFWQSLSRDG